jgi:hypothetical protein
MFEKASRETMVKLANLPALAYESPLPKAVLVSAMVDGGNTVRHGVVQLPRIGSPPYMTIT